MQAIIIMLIAVVVMFLIERWWPANGLPKVPHWWPRVILTNFVQVAIVFIMGLTWDKWLMTMEWSPPWAVRQYMGIVGQVAIGYIGLTFIYYWWHRVRHDSQFLWKLCHQIHHSPRRMEVLMSFYKYPVEITINGLLSSFIVFPLIGCTPQAAALVTLATGLAEFFYHWNISTPRWLGPFFQRPESHRVHHQKNHHTNNYSDIPLWDIIFGTYQNPKEKIAECGYTASREDRFEDMLGFRDVHAKGSDKLSPLHLLPSCLGCSKRWACHESRTKNSKNDSL